MIDKKFLKVTQTILMNRPKIFKFKISSSAWKEKNF